ncbi:MAG: hypothetical protein ACXACG_04560 [Candidatus Thorarchaeota archaeon]|jgi:hypothetical protein
MSHRPKEKKDALHRAGLKDFRFDPTELDLKWTKDLITTFDGYRIHRTFDLTFIEKAVGQGAFPESFIGQWKTIRSVLHKFAAIGPEVPGVMTALKRRMAIQYLALILMTIMIPLAVLTFAFNWTSIVWIVFPMVIVAVVFIFGQMLSNAWFNRKIAWAIQDYLDLDPGRLRDERIALREWVQILIDHCSRLMRRQGEDPDDNPVKFYNDDYKRIFVHKEPRLLRKHYIVLLQL